MSQSPPDRLDRIERILEQTGSRLDQIAEKLDQTAELSQRTASRLDQITEKLDQTAELSQRTASRLDQIAEKLDQTAELSQQTERQQQHLTSRFDSLVFETQRLFNRIGEQQSRNEAAIESLSDAVTRLTRNSEADRVRWIETQNEIRQIWQYLLQQRGNGRSES